jgi:hypothetical protein
MFWTWPVFVVTGEIEAPLTAILYAVLFAQERH